MVSITPSVGRRLPPAVGWEGDLKRLCLAAPCSPGWEKPGQTPVCLVQWGFFLFLRFQMIFTAQRSANVSRPWGMREDGCVGSPVRARLGEVASGPAMPSEAAGTSVGTSVGTLRAPRLRCCLCLRSPWLMYAQSFGLWGFSLSSCCETFICF